MTIYEDVRRRMSEQLNHDYQSMDAVASDLYMMRVTPCDLNEEFDYLSEEEMDAFCAGKACGVATCLIPYLEREYAERTTEGGQPAQEGDGDAD